MLNLTITKPRLIQLLHAFAYVEMIRMVYKKELLEKLTPRTLMLFQHRKISTMESLLKIHITKEEVEQLYDIIALQLLNTIVNEERFLQILLAFCVEGMDKMAMESISKKKEKSDQVLDKLATKLLGYKTMQQIKATKKEVLELHGAIAYFKIVKGTETMIFKK